MYALLAGEKRGCDEQEQSLEDQLVLASTSAMGASAKQVVIVISTRNSAMHTVTPFQGKRFGSRATRHPTMVATKIIIAHGIASAIPP